MQRDAKDGLTSVDLTSCHSGRAMRRDDLPAVADLFARVFRGGVRAPDDGLEAYLETLCFGSPHWTPRTGSLVYEAPPGEIHAAILSMPMRFRADGEPIVGRLLGSFMADGNEGKRGAAWLSRHFRARNHDLLFSDTARAVSADHWRVAGGQVLPIHSLDWTRVFRPLGGIALRLAQGRSRIGRALAYLPHGLPDRLVRRARPSLRAQMPAGYGIEETDRAGFLAAARTMLPRFTVHPDWDAAELAWLGELVAGNRHLGPLHLRLVTGSDAKPVAAYAYCGRGRGKATVLNLLCREKREADAVSALYAELDNAGYALAGGMAQRFLMTALQRHPHVTFRHRGFFCIASRRDAVNEAARQGQFYAGGFASETWSRLLVDF
ncbi:GNAT family N-acetyltransferase [Stappia sp.]|jgi:hypothetical protein|uniref:GNAT family N-acetyltransferase n=1 Tax=Stappia sp. TaxID=1870903 RepID=UPI003D0E954B